MPAAAQAPPDDTRPLSPAQLALFETPHLANITKPETLQYNISRTGAAPFADTIGVVITTVNPNGTKDVAFQYMTGERQVRLPELDGFRGNPLLMVTLERDVEQMHEAIGLSKVYFRNRIREAFVAGAKVEPIDYTVDGQTRPARQITVTPFIADQRLERLPSLQAKLYTFVLTDAVPGMLAEIRIDTPAETSMGVPAISQTTVFEGVTP